VSVLISVPGLIIQPGAKDSWVLSLKMGNLCLFAKENNMRTEKEVCANCIHLGWEASKIIGGRDFYPVCLIANKILNVDIHDNIPDWCPLKKMEVNYEGKFKNN